MDFKEINKRTIPMFIEGQEEPVEVSKVTLFFEPSEPILPLLMLEKRLRAAGIEVAIAGL